MIDSGMNLVSLQTIGRSGIGPRRPLQVRHPSGYGSYSCEQVESLRVPGRKIEGDMPACHKVYRKTLSEDHYFRRCHRDSFLAAQSKCWTGDKFVYDPATDTYLCPEGQRLPFRGLRRKTGKVQGPFRVYWASRTVCRACPAYGVCTKDVHSGRALWIGPTDALLR